MRISDWSSDVCSSDLDGADRQRPVDERNAERPQQGRPRRLSVAALQRRKDEENQSEHEGEMDAAVNGLLQEAEAGGVVVEERQHEEAAADDPADGWPQRPEADFQVELLLELARLRLVELQARPWRLILGQGHRRSMVCRIPALSA